ncbi:uncharacterized protein EAF02_011605 [Botrytis sinoallii]|uniref:uncharacterized protein n=1 Tax=Botrytis sinoallii TaxID=1463999 RepID=UPI0018FF1E2B|nr:uncharacterized protein EAF02_011605 [Botrytis sinoallii]KAF7854430.1 hypothetical protein EAF02_011605 [Botrytis sinoallii]
MDTFQDLSSLALEFQVESTIKSTGEPEVIRKRDQFKNAWQELADMTLDVEDETDNNNPQQSQGPTEFHTKFHLFPKLPLEIRRMIWGLTVTPRVIESKNCVLPMEEANYANDWDPMPLIPRALCPLNIVSYSGMPAAFWACFESRNAVAAYYHNIAVVPKEIEFKHGNLPIGTLEKYRSAKFSDFYCIDKQTLEFESIREETFSFPLQPSVPFNPDTDIFNFDSLGFDVHVVNHHLAEANLLYFQIPLPADWKPWRRVDEEMSSWLIHPWAVKRAQITPESGFWSIFRHDFTNGLVLPMEPVIFSNFIFQDLDEFILQDADCLLYHKFDLPINRNHWRSYLMRMFRVEASHNEFAAMRAGSKFKIPKVTILPGAKISKRCKHCIEKQRIAREIFVDRKDLKYQHKQKELRMVEKFGKDKALWVYPRRYW